MPGFLLTKSKYINALQCSKYIWTIVNNPDLIPAADEQQMSVFEQGNRIESVARTLFPGGIDLAGYSFQDNIRETAKSLSARRPLFEAGFMAGDLYGRADVLDPVKGGRWDLYEIKAATRMDDIYVKDAAFQAYCYRSAGLKLNRIFIMHVDNTYIREGELDAGSLLKADDITAMADDDIKLIPDRLKAIFAVVKLKASPQVPIGPHCNSPYECPLKGHCWSHIPDKDSIFTLYGIGRKSWDFYNRGIAAVSDISLGTKLTEKQEIQVSCVKSGRKNIDRGAVRSFVKTLEYPLHFLDFETFSSAIPPFSGTSAYQAIPFQYSLHIVDAPGKKARHYMYLHDGKDDPRPSFYKSLKKDILESGSIVVFNQSFEKRILSGLARVVPEARPWAAAVIDRIADLYTPFGKFQWYSPRQQGSASLKKVLPAITGKDYSALEIADGSTADRMYKYMTFDDGISVGEKAGIRKNLELYCGLDTEGMIWILDELKKI